VHTLFAVSLNIAGGSEALLRRRRASFRPLAARRTPLARVARPALHAARQLRRP